MHGVEDSGRTRDFAQVRAQSAVLPYTPAMSKVHPFDRYADFTDVAVLKEASDKPLRKSMRVNTLKISVEQFTDWGKKKAWQMTPVPWCKEAFYIDRENREEALGKDLLHLLGAAYMQEAASMLPVELLDPQPGETILDMSAAPGSKSTQVAARLQGRGLVICNDIQEKRLWTLKTALHRSGAWNTIVTRKVGQWFSKQMTEKFDRVLCDAPCTAQGTARKDSDALDFCGPENIGKMAKLQRELLEAAIDATKVGGIIVYSTCTLTPEENEEAVSSMLRRFPDQLEVVDPRTIDPKFECLQKGIEDSELVQRLLGFEKPFPVVRLWPQTYDTEGFFCAVLRKLKPTRHPIDLPPVHFQEEEMPAARMREWAAKLEETYGTSFLQEGDRLFERGELLLLTSQDVAKFRMPVADYALGIPFGKKVDGTRIRLDHDIAVFRGNLATKNVTDISEETLNLLLDGKDATCDESLRGDVILRFQNMAVGIGLAKEGHLKNRLPRWIVQKS